MKLSCSEAKELAIVKRKEKLKAYELDESRQKVLDDVCGVITRAIDRNKARAWICIGCKRFPNSYTPFAKFIIDHCRLQGYQVEIVPHDPRATNVYDEDIRISGW